jgi:hypothetical protein
LSAEQFDIALDLLDIEQKATFFVGLPSGEVRDCWLERYTSIQLIVQEYSNEEESY